ncbi:MAG: 50S ribosomal protein L5 [Holosporales bacterium]|jgi:large subunit ribosomal protein L5|nr:50S ribosomal protein L5 [Holosporales bacterium]
MKEKLRNSLKERFDNEIKPKLAKALGFANKFEVPYVTKVVLNMGVGEAAQDNKKLGVAVEELTMIAGQRAVPTKAKKSIAAFKVRTGMEVGARVTLRGDRMYEFLDRLVNIALPRVRDFHGFSAKSFDGHGNYSLGIKEHIIFPEINYDKVDKIRGMDVVICTSSRDDKAALLLLQMLNLPIR